MAGVIRAVVAREFVRNNYTGVSMKLRTRSGKAKEEQLELSLDEKLSSDVERFKQALIIDKHALDDAVEQHSVLYLEAQEEYERAVSMRDAAKIALDECYATRSAEIRAQFEEDKERYTEQRIKDEIATDKTYLDAMARYTDAKSRAAQLGAIVSAFEHRKTMLRIEADLWLGGYWADAAMKAPQEKVKDRLADDARSSMRQSRRTR